MNLWGKSRKVSEPYVTVTYGDWTWKILKAYQTRKAELGNKYARWFCAVSSPMTGGSFDMGDCYVSDVPMTGDLQAALDERLIMEAEARAK
jgi:hypothetical protein